MAKHRRFNADRFLDKFQGREVLLRNYVGLWDGRLELDGAKLDVPKLKEFLVNGDGEGIDEMFEGLYRAFDLCTERGEEDLVAACREFVFEPDPAGDIPVECLSLKVRTENEEAFDLAYARNTLWKAEQFSLFQGKEAKPIADIQDAAIRLQERLAEVFKDDKKSDRVLIRQYQEELYTNFIVYHEKRTKAELVFKGTKARLKVSPTILRPAQQDFVSYNTKTGQIEIEARFENEEAVLRKNFAECCLGDKDFFEGEDAAKRIKLARIAEDDFNMPVNEEKGHTAVLIELHFKFKQQYAPSFVVRSRNVLGTLEKNSLRKRLEVADISKAVFKITFPDDQRGKRVVLSGINKVRFKRATHAEEVFQYLKDWKVVLD